MRPYGVYAGDGRADVAASSSGGRASLLIRYEWASSSPLTLPGRDPSPELPARTELDANGEFRFSYQGEPSPRPVASDADDDERHPGAPAGTALKRNTSRFGLGA